MNAEFPADTAPALPVAPARPATILCVDDEANILAALRRLFHPHGYRVLCADSGAAGLAVLDSESVDLVISDMRMPHMDGAQFLAEVRRRQPHCLRLVLTGYSDMAAILDAVNNGEIYRYISKPWDDAEVLMVVRDALARHALEALSRAQHAALEVLNLGLEQKVAERTEALRASHDAILAANGKLKSTFLTTIKVFSNLIELRGGPLAVPARGVAELVRKLGTALALPAHNVDQLCIAALLKDIGKLTLSDTLLAMPVSAYSGEQLALFRKHPLRASQLLMPLEELRDVALILRAQLERYDGNGFPDGIEGAAIPLGARILTLAADYAALQSGALVQRHLRPDEARPLIYDSAGKRYDPAVVTAFRQVMDEPEPADRGDMAVLSGEMVPGMVLSLDLYSREGLMLLPAEQLLDPDAIQQLLDFENKSEGRLRIRVYRANPAEARQVPLIRPLRLPPAPVSPSAPATASASVPVPVLPESAPPPARAAPADAP